MTRDREAGPLSPATHAHPQRTASGSSVRLTEREFHRQVVQADSCRAVARLHASRGGYTKPPCDDDPGVS